MLSLTDGQMAGLSTAVFSKLLKQHWLEVFPGRVLDSAPASDRDLALACILESGQLGIEARGDVTVYGDLCIAAGAGFAHLAGGRRT